MTCPSLTTHISPTGDRFRTHTLTHTHSGTSGTQSCYLVCVLWPARRVHNYCWLAVRCSTSVGIVSKETGEHDRARGVAITTNVPLVDRLACVVVSIRTSRRLTWPKYAIVVEIRWLRADGKSRPQTPASDVTGRRLVWTVLLRLSMAFSIAKTGARRSGLLMPILSKSCHL